LLFQKGKKKKKKEQSTIRLLAAVIVKLFVGKTSDFLKMRGHIPGTALTRHKAGTREK